MPQGRIPTTEEAMVFARLKYYRKALNHIHEGGSIYYDKGRMDSYIIIAKLASNERRTLQ
jgi:hypothetical protein